MRSLFPLLYSIVSSSVLKKRADRPDTIPPPTLRATTTPLPEGSGIFPLGSSTADQAGDGCSPQCIEGRRPTGYLAPPEELRLDWLRSIPAHVAEIAHMELAAVRAFEDLHAALICVGAPTDLVRRTRQARRDEVAHAQIMSERATSLGARVPPMIAVPRVKHPSFLELALDNMIEGCVRETYGALVATYQSRHAKNPDLRAAFARIAADEAEHAALAQDLAAWFASKLTREERAEVDAAKRKAFEDLRRECAATHPSYEVEHEAGMPRAEIAVSLLELLRDRMKPTSSSAAA